MKRLFALFALPLALAACASASDASYKLTFDTQDKDAQNALALTSMTVIERRLDALGELVQDKEIIPGDDGSTIRVTLSSKEVADALTAQLTEPYTLQIMKEVPEGQGIKVENHGSFGPTGITEKDLTGGEAAQDSQGKGAVKLNFTSEGLTKLATVFKENNGKSIGIFVRDRLISKLNVKSDQLEEYIVIRDIPDPQLAQVFVDDLNVGLHVTFTPLP